MLLKRATKMERPKPEKAWTMNEWQYNNNNNNKTHLNAMFAKRFEIKQIAVCVCVCNVRYSPHRSKANRCIHCIFVCYVVVCLCGSSNFHRSKLRPFPSIASLAKHLSTFQLSKSFSRAHNFSHEYFTANAGLWIHIGFATALLAVHTIQRCTIAYDSLSTRFPTKSVTIFQIRYAFCFLLNCILLHNIWLYFYLHLYYFFFRCVWMRICFGFLVLLLLLPWYISLALTLFSALMIFVYSQQYDCISILL